jgi:hypothetical protein
LGRGSSEIRRCIDLQRSHIVDAVRSREDCAALLKHLCAISRPSTGAPLVLLLFARMATPECAWLDGGLQVDAIGEGEKTTFDVLQDLGVGMGERLFPRAVMKAPLSEFVRALRRVPAMSGPLEVQASPTRLVLWLSSTARLRASTPPNVTKAQSSFLLTPPTPGVAFVPPGKRSEKGKPR